MPSVFPKARLVEEPELLAERIRVLPFGIEPYDARVLRPRRVAGLFKIPIYVYNDPSISLSVGVDWFVLGTLELLNLADVLRRRN